MMKMGYKLYSKFRKFSILVMVIITGCSVGGFDNSRLKYENTILVEDSNLVVTIEPEIMNCLNSAHLEPVYVEDDNASMALVAGVVYASFSSEISKQEWETKYSADKFDLDCLAQEETDSREHMPSFYQIDLSSADLNLVSYWLFAMGVTGEVHFNDENALATLALTAQMEYEDTRKVRISPLLVGYQTDSLDTAFFPPPINTNPGTPTLFSTFRSEGGCSCIDENGTYYAQKTHKGTSCESAYTKSHCRDCSGYAISTVTGANSHARHECAEDEDIYDKPPDRQNSLILERANILNSGASTPIDILIDGSTEQIHFWVIPDGSLNSEGQFVSHDWINDVKASIDSHPAQFDESCLGSGIRNQFNEDHGEDTIVDDFIPGNKNSENKQCEYATGSQVSIDYNRYILYNWAEGEEKVAFFAFEGDECMDLGLFGCVCNIDDYLAFFVVERSDTQQIGGFTYLDNDLELTVRTIDECDCSNAVEEGSIVFGENGEASYVPLDLECCDGRDNDCDGEADEPDEMWGAGVQCGSQIGDCEPGVRACQGDNTKEEPCLCDPLLDTGLFKSDVCGNDLECIGAYTPSTEICGDHEDNNCNGSIDEGFGECCDEDIAQCAWDIGECTTGEKVCSNNLWSECLREVEPIPEGDCNGLDDDCDGSIDEYVNCGCVNGATMPCGYSDIGECSYGAQTCVEGTWQACNITASELPQEEMCDGLDNDCDGITDEAPADFIPCTVSGCAGGDRYGYQECKGGVLEELCDALLDEEDPEVICDGIDNDCDLEVDELNVPENCGGEGACHRERTSTCDDSCYSGLPEPCPKCGAVAGEDYNCNGIDDIDEIGDREIEGDPSEDKKGMGENGKKSCKDHCDNDCDGLFDCDDLAYDDEKDDCFEPCFTLSGGREAR